MNAYNHQKGVAAVELALLLIPLTTLVFGITEFGRAIYQYNTIAKGTRDAARYLTQTTPGNGASRAAARCLVVFGNRACSGAPLVTGMDDDATRALAALRQPGSTAIALVHVPSDDRSPQATLAGGTLASLVAAGWLAAPVTGSESPARVWGDLTGATLPELIR